MLWVFVIKHSYFCLFVIVSFSPYDDLDAVNLGENFHFLTSRENWLFSPTWRPPALPSGNLKCSYCCSQNISRKRGQVLDLWWPPCCRTFQSWVSITWAVLVCPQQCQQPPPLPLFLPTWSRSPRRRRRAPCSRRTEARWKCRRTSSPLSAHSLPVSLHKLVPYVLKGSVLWMPKIFMRKLPVWVGWQAKWNFGNKNLSIHFLKRFRSKKPLKFATIFDIF